MWTVTDRHSVYNCSNCSYRYENLPQPMRLLLPTRWRRRLRLRPTADVLLLLLLPPL
jgi:hypothetical protein